MSKPRPWPNNAKDARDNAAEAAQGIIRLSVALASRVREGKFTRVGVENDLNRIILLAQHALRELEAQGAQTRPTREVIDYAWEDGYDQKTP